MNLMSAALIWTPNKLGGFTARGGENREYNTWAIPEPDDPEYPVMLVTGGITSPYKYRDEYAAQKAAQATEDLIVMGDQALLDGHQELADATRDHLAEQHYDLGLDDDEEDQS